MADFGAGATRNTFTNRKATSVDIVIRCQKCGETYTRDMTTLFEHTSRTIRDGFVRDRWQHIEAETNTEVREFWRCPKHHLTEEHVTDY